jgi:hypothetical protein
VNECAFAKVKVDDETSDPKTFYRGEELLKQIATYELRLRI